MNPRISTVTLVRHGCSTANLDPSVYLRVPDHSIPMARPDDDPDADAAGELVGSLALDREAVCCWVSPFVRCLQTEQLVMRRAFGEGVSLIQRRESFLLREQEFGDWDGLTDVQIAERDPVRFAKRTRMDDKLGRFYFRPPCGESRAEVVQRIAILIGKVHRSRYVHHVIFLHGVTQRAFRMAWFNYSVEWFEAEPNPRNASVLHIRREPTTGRWTERYLAPAPRAVK